MFVEKVFQNNKAFCANLHYEITKLLCCVVNDPEIFLLFFDIPEFYADLKSFSFSQKDYNCPINAKCIF
jgi:hypothetical protein